MSASAKEWAFIALFFAILLAVSFAEILWLNRKNGIDLRRSMIAVLMPNFLTITLGFLVSFLSFGILLALSGDQDAAASGGGAARWIVFGMAMLFPLIFSAALRSVLISTLKFSLANTRFKSPFRCSLISSAVFLIAVVGIPALTLFIF